MGKLIILIGTSLSGKTTFAKDYLTNNKNTYYVSRDTERENIFGVYRNGNPKEESIITEIVNNKIWSCLKIGDVLLDNANIVQEHLNELIEEFKYSYDIEFIEMPLLDKHELIKRNQKRFFETGKLIPERVLHYQINDFNKLIIPNNIYNNGTKFDKRISYNKKYDHSLQDCIIVDLDGTLSLINNRNPFNGEDCMSDVVNNSVKMLLDTIPKHVCIFLLSGRNESNGGRQNTLNWLSENNIRYDNLIMRKENDNRPDYIVKKEMYNDYINRKFNCIFCLDDRDSIVKLWRNIGLDCFQVYNGNF